MRIVFMGTPEFSAVILEELIQCHDVVAVYTRPDAIRGRGKRAVPSPVKTLAQNNGIEVRTPRTLRSPEEQAYLASLDADAICVAAYGAILPKEVLESARYGCLNVHGSILPRWRGAAPIERAILAGDEETGVCIMRMEEGLDTGPWCVCRTCAIEHKSAGRLTEELAALGATALITALAHVEAGALEWVEQDESLVTYASKIEKGELNLDPAVDAATNDRRVRASSDAHPSKAIIEGRGVTVLEASLFTPDERVAYEDLPTVGKTRYLHKKLILGCSSGWLSLDKLKPDGKKAMEASAFVAGIPALRTGSGSWEESSG